LGSLWVSGSDACRELAEARQGLEVPCPPADKVQCFAVIAFAGRTATLADVFSAVSEPLWFPWLAERRYNTTIGAITTRGILYWLAAMVVLLVVGTIIGLIWADTSDVAARLPG
jgi:hypothetical protein